VTISMSVLPIVVGDPGASNGFAITVTVTGGGSGSGNSIATLWKIRCAASA